MSYTALCIANKDLFHLFDLCLKMIDFSYYYPACETNIKQHILKIVILKKYMHIFIPKKGSLLILKPSDPWAPKHVFESNLFPLLILLLSLTACQHLLCLDFTSHTQGIFWVGGNPQGLQSPTLSHHRTTRKPNPIAQNVVQMLLELWQLGVIPTALGNLCHAHHPLVKKTFV